MEYITEISGNNVISLKEIIQAIMKGEAWSNRMASHLYVDPGIFSAMFQIKHVSKSVSWIRKCGLYCLSARVAVHNKKNCLPT